MSDIPPWFSEGSDSLEIGESVLPVGKHTCHRCQTEADGGDPDAWWVTCTHAQLASLNEDLPIAVDITGTFDVDWERIVISESGNAASCAKRTTLTTGRDGTLNYEFNHVITVEKRACLPISDSIGSLDTSAGTEIPGPTQSGSIAVTNNQTGVAICGSTGCTSGDYGAFNSDGTSTFTADQSSGVGIIEKFCRSGSNAYKYQFTSIIQVALSEGGFVAAYLYSGPWDWDRFGGEPPEASLPEWTLSAEEDVGTVRGIAIKAKYLSYELDHADSTITGTPGNCPNPSYSSDVTIGTTTGSIAVTISG